MPTFDAPFAKQTISRSESSFIPFRASIPPQRSYKLPKPAARTAKMCRWMVFKFACRHNHTLDRTITCDERPRSLWEPQWGAACRRYAREPREPISTDACCSERCCNRELDHLWLCIEHDMQLGNARQQEEANEVWSNATTHHLQCRMIRASIDRGDFDDDPGDERRWPRPPLRRHRP